jgi:hypothetical protein
MRKRGYTVTTQFEDGSSDTEEVRFLSWGWLLISATRVLGRLASLHGPHRMKDGTVVVTREDGVVEYRDPHFGD